MAIISPEEVLKIARASQLALHADEINGVVKQLQDVLNYAQRVQERSSCKNAGVQAGDHQINVWRADNVIVTNAMPLLGGAPVREGNFFVVPMILENGQ